MKAKLKRVNVRVTADDISGGICADARQCMLARAITAHIKPLYFVKVLTPDGSVHRRCSGQRVAGFQLSAGALRAIQKFDDNRSAKPATYRVYLPENILL